MEENKSTLRAKIRRIKKPDLSVCPLQLLIAIVDDNQTDEVVKVMQNFEEKGGVLTFARGTAESEVVDLFGFGHVEKRLVFNIIKTKNSEEIVKELTQVLQLETENTKGIVMTIPINALEKSMLKYFNVKLETK